MQSLYLYYFRFGEEFPHFIRGRLLKTKQRPPLVCPLLVRQGGSPLVGRTSLSTFWNSWSGELQSQQSATSRVVPSGCVGSYGEVFLFFFKRGGYFTVISLAKKRGRGRVGKREDGWEECDDRVRARRAGLPGVRGGAVCACVCEIKPSLNSCQTRATTDWEPACASVCVCLYSTLYIWANIFTFSSSLESFLFSSVSSTRSLSYLSLYSASNSSRSLWLDRWEIKKLNMTLR